MIKFIFTLALWISGTCFAQQYGWVDYSGNLPDYPFDTTIINVGVDTIYAHISDISFIDDNEGWVTTWHPFSDQSAAILHTTDGGGAWEVQTVMRPCQVIHMLDENVGYAGSSGGMIFKTLNGGTNWDFMGITGAPITGMSFPSGSDTGYVCSYGTSKMHQITPEGLNTINFENAPFWWNSVAAPSHELIWLSIGTSIYTYDQNGLTDQPITSDNYNSVCFIHNDLGWGCGYHGVKEKNPGTIGGCVGKDIGWVVLQYTEQVLNDIFALDENHVWAVGSDGYIHYSENASDFGFDTITSTGWSDVVFTNQYNPRPEADFQSVYFTSPQNGFASASNNILLKYTKVSSLSEKQNTAFKILPNPSAGLFSVQCYEFRKEFVKIEMVDVHGKVISVLFKGIPDSDRITCDVNQLCSGIYFCRIYSSGLSATQKIIIQK